MIFSSSEVYIADLETLKVKDKIQLGNDSHCLWKEDDEFFTLSSRERLVRGSKGTKIDLPTIEDDILPWPRGVSILPEEEVRIVGVSPKAQRAGRKNSQSRIWIFDWKWNLKKEVFLGNWGNLFEIRTPGFFDLGSPWIFGPEL